MQKENGITWFFEQWDKVKRQFRIVYVPDKNEVDKLIRFQQQSYYFTAVTALCFALTGIYYKSIEWHYAASEINLDLSVARAISKAEDCDGEWDLRKWL